MVDLITLLIIWDIRIYGCTLYNTYHKPLKFQITPYCNLSCLFIKLHFNNDVKICRYKIHCYLNLKTKLKLRMYFLKITSIFISISLNSTYYPEFNLEASWGGCKPILLLNYCTSRETLLACSTVANHIMFLYFNVPHDDKLKIYNII